MLPSETLAFWANACGRAGISWYLYKETLLCANGYPQFPEDLKTAQVLVHAHDLPVMIQEVFPLLPADWKFSSAYFSFKRTPLTFSINGVPVLEIHLLLPAESEEHAAAITEELRVLRKKAAKKAHNRHLMTVLFRKIGKKLTTRGYKKASAKSYDALLSYCASSSASGAFYTDTLTEKDAVLFPASALESAEPLLCGGTAYPTFAGYRTYLADTYGDYEAGLTDAIGVGLTVEEKAALQEHQQNCRTALAFIQEVAKEYNLRYYLLAGSVLGPVRHQGFIPWDDDIDLGIRIEDLAEFERVIAKELPKRLPEQFELVQSGPNNPYPRMFSKLCCNGRCCMDFWPLVPTYENGFRAKWTWYFAKIITKVHYRKINYKVTRFVKLVNLMARFMSDKLVMKLARHNERKYAKRNTPAYINLYSIYKRPKENILRKWLDTPATALFDGIEVPIVGCTHDYLTHLYGNYMAFPAPWKRASRHVERFYATEEDETHEDPAD